MSKPWHRYPPGFKARIFERDGGHCRIQLPDVCTHHPTCPGCATDLDHIIPPRLGGMWFTDTNCRAACSPCNQARRRTTPRSTPKTLTPPEHW